MSSAVIGVTMSGFATTPAVIAAAQNANRWLAPKDRRSELLDTQYFHVVFTVPQPITAIALQNKQAVYNILFRAAAETLRIAADLPLRISSGRS